MAPDKELARLVVLDKVVGFGLPSQPVLARYCRTAAALFRTPIAFVSVVRTDQIQFLASQGLRTTSARRDPGLCSATIEQRGCRVIRDARGELRGAENSLVQGEPGIRFYAGTPLCHRGVAIGTLAVADSVPRTPGSHQVDTLLELTALLEAEIAENLQSAQGALDRMRSAKKEEVRAWLAYGLSHEYSNALTGAMALEETLTSIS